MRRRKTAIFFLVLGICVIALAVVLNVSWILLNVREVALLVFGIIVFALIITGMVLNTTFLFREIKRSEQHDAFLNSVTHELKTPIASIKLYLETLKTREVSREKRVEFYDVMLEDSDRLLATVEQILQASRTRDKKRQISISRLDVFELLRDVSATIRTRRKLPEGVIRLAEPTNPIFVIGDQAELRTAFSNLIDNAVKYSEADPKVSIRMKRSSKYAEIFIRDNGIGIAKGELKRIFKRFYRVSDTKVNDRKGTGLGLWIVRSIVEKHGGSIRAQSRGEGTGSTFFVRLPAADDEIADVKINESSDR